MGTKIFIVMECESLYMRIPRLIGLPISFQEFRDQGYTNTKQSNMIPEEFMKFANFQIIK